MQAADTPGFPLSPALTERVVKYLNGFRLFISAALLSAYLAGLLVPAVPIRAEFAATVLIAYLLAAVFFELRARRAGTDVHDFARVSLLADVIIVGTLLYVFGGLGSGLGVLLVYTAATAAILLPLRVALFIAALAALAIVGEGLLGMLVPGGRPGSLLQSGLYGLVLFVITLLAHVLGFWLRDFRLIAERQMVTLSRLEQINELIIRRMRSGVLAVDHEGEIRMMNESAWFLLGNPAASDRLLDDVSPELAAAIRDWREDPKMETRPVTLAASQADVIPKFVSLPAGRDISVLVFLEDNDVVSRRALEMSANSLAKLSGSIAHEIRNPLSAVTHAAQLLAESDNLDESGVRLVDIIEKQSRRMNGIVENILQLSRREKSRPELIDLWSWLRELAAELRGAHPDLPLDLACGGRAEGAAVAFDPGQLHQVAWKLLDNAVHHAARGAGEPRIGLRLDVEEESGFCVLSVEDNGPGIDERHLSDIFEPFYTTRQEGSGLGLYIARQLCEANQAELTVDSTPGWKTRFHIRMAQAAGQGGESREIEPTRETR